jgi:plasmid stabilization system protein ParE
MAHVELLPEAMEEARDARLWYSERDVQAGERFVGALDEAIEAIAAAPLRWPVHAYGTRRYQLRRFPYLIVYRVLDSDRVQVVACQHGRRKPGYWKGRLG